MSAKQITKLTENLKRMPSSSLVANPYRVDACAKNLRAYLGALCKWPFSGYLLVGEAPGYRGCALTGIPFTSERILSSSEHPFLAKLRPAVVVGGKAAEGTATIVWEYCIECDGVSAFWNIFPFHPHKLNSALSNRTPTASEIQSGRPYVEQVIEILSPERIIAVGTKATNAIKNFFPALEFVGVPHPSYGNKMPFLEGLSAAGIRRRDCQ